MSSTKLCYWTTSKLCYWSTSKLCYWNTSKLCYIITSKLDPHLATDRAIGGAHDRPAASSSSSVFIPRSDCPSIPARGPAAAHGRGVALAALPPHRAASRHRASRHPDLFYLRVSPLPPTTSTPNSARSWLHHSCRPSPLLRTALDGILDSNSDCASARKKEGTRRAGPAPVTRYTRSTTGYAYDLL
jgi:hypothetical protein